MSDSFLYIGNNWHKDLDEFIYGEMIKWEEKKALHPALRNQTLERLVEAGETTKESEDRRGMQEENQNKDSASKTEGLVNSIKCCLEAKWHEDRIWWGEVDW